jgi:formylglycine-generating enzyme
VNSPSPYGTFDQGGNVREWNETAVDLPGGPMRGERGGSFFFQSNFEQASYRNSHSGDSTYKDEDLGFRIASIPEPGSITLGVVGAATLMLWIRTKQFWQCH